MKYAALLALQLLGACSSSLGPDDDASGAQWAYLGRDCANDAPATLLPEAARDSLPPPGRNSWADLARRAPGGWGGYFLDDGVPTMYMLDTSQVEAAAAFLRAEGLPIASSVVARQGRWDFAQLTDWYRYLNRFIWAVDGWSFSDIQEARNRLEYGVIDEVTWARVEQVLADLEFDVPCFLVALKVSGYAVDLRPQLK